MKIDLSKITYGFFGACAVAGLTYLGVTKYYEKEIAFGSEYKGVMQVMDDIDKFYYNEPDKEEYERNMVSGLLDGLDDVYTYCQSNSQASESAANNSMQMQTAGFKIGQDEQTHNMIVTEVVTDSYAEEIGLHVGDIIISIDGKNVKETGYAKSCDNLLGKSDTSAELMVDHEGTVSKITYVRSSDKERFLPISKEVLDNGIFYYRFSSFDEGTALDFKNSFDNRNEENEIKSVIFDLRGNGGGVIPEAVELFDYFAPSGSHVVCEHSKTGEKEVYKTTDEIPLKDIKVVVLVSEETMSSGEILAALFSNTGRGTVIGTQTGGKGVFQKGGSLPGMQSYAIVTGYYYVNDIPNYNGVGITPDMVVDMEKRFIGTDNDIQLEKAIELLS